MASNPHNEQVKQLIEQYEGKEADRVVMTDDDDADYRADFEDGTTVDFWVDWNKKLLENMVHVVRRED